MIKGIGVDTTTVERVAESMQNEHFLQRVFSAEERALFAGRSEKHAAESAAGCFAAKEAFLKAAGRGLGGFALADIAVLRKESGAPYFVLAGEAAQFCKQNALRAHLSITHEGGLATAFVLLEENPAPPLFRLNKTQI